MTQEQLQELIARYLREECTAEEKLRLQQWYEQRFAAEPIAWELRSEADIAQLKARMRADIWERTALSGKAKSLSRRQFVYRVAASIALFCCLSAGLYFILRKDETSLPVASNTNSSGIRLTTATGEQVDVLSAAESTLASYGLQRSEEDGKTLLKVLPGEAKASTAPTLLRTGAREQTVVELLDGSKVWLNATSELRYQRQGTLADLRQVSFSGEAFFEIKKDATQPFQVRVENQVIEVLGTSFNLNSYAGLLECALLEGKVKIGDNTLKPGQLMRISPVEQHIQSFDIDEVTAWKKGYLQFHDAELAGICAKLSKWYQVDIEVGISKPVEPLTGTLSLAASLEDNLEILEKISGIKINREGRTVRINN
ncbi:MAG: FecR family protein [Sphingobacterium hotanense]